MAPDAVPLASFAPRTRPNFPPPTARHPPSSPGPSPHVRAVSAAPQTVGAAMALDVAPPALFAPRAQPSLLPPSTPRPLSSAGRPSDVQAPSAAPLTVAEVVATAAASSCAEGTRTLPTTATTAAAAQDDLSQLYPPVTRAVADALARAPSAMNAAAASAPARGTPTPNTGAGGTRIGVTRRGTSATPSVARAAAVATAAAAASSSASMAARRPLAAARAAPSAGAQDSGALARAVAAASVLARAAPAASQAPRADASQDEDGEEELSDDQETLREALSPGGRGWVIMGNAIPSEWTDFVRRGAYRKSSRTAQPIINSQLHEKMEELGDAADTGRRQVPVPSGGRGRGNRQRNHFAREVRRTLATVAARVGNEFDVAYDGVTPHILITMPRTPAQLAHTDTGLYLEEGGSGATLLSVYVSFEEGTFVDVWPGTFGGAGDGTEPVALPPPLRVAIPVGSCLIVRSDLVHRGTENLRARGQLRCIHAYLAVHVDGEHMAYAEHMSFLSQYI
ncbi:hypothetical protein BU14_0056s0004 [Porphyra umbilicalis]|uniref:Uncharacterized protein n=1 Tax=Porphyra umbilicalis TaxID=2786 RepID=A0A1X6PHA5_PORUM|nr:hypothetical protein BU14_0056s0004 [Porphyra umbilicalis]|eukprot:OSX80220.1 hypothetical protein BU14_0056s0004 [Porphyra umbilicalis]